MWLLIGMTIFLVIVVNLLTYGFSTPFNLKRRPEGWAATLRVLPGWYLGLARIRKEP